jgi:pilus assembly protein Flp/PilA
MLKILSVLCLARASLPGRKGQGLVEYAMILSLVAVVVVLVLAILGPAVGNVFSNILNVADAYGGGESPEGGPSPPEAPPECYGSLLLPIMISATGAVVAASALVPRRAAADQPA